MLGVAVISGSATQEKPVTSMNKVNEAWELSLYTA